MKRIYFETNKIEYFDDEEFDGSSIFFLFKFYLLSREVGQDHVKQIKIQRVTFLI